MTDIAKNSAKIDIPHKSATKTGIDKLSNIPRISFDWPKVPVPLQKGMYSFKVNNLEYDFLYNTSEEKKIFVFFSGDADRTRYSPPVFQRWTWSKYFPGHCLFIADPALKLFDDLALGWYTGTSSEDPIPTISELIKEVALSLNISLNNIILYGSSGGAYAALRLSSFIPEVTVVAINPQIDITLFYKSKVELLLNKCFDSISVDKAKEVYPNRFSIIPIHHKIANNKVLYVQNISDKHHYNLHFKLFAQKFELNENNNFKHNNIEALFFEHPDGHKRAETTEIFPILIDKAIKLTEK